MKKIADTVIYGNFYTVDKENPKADAVAIADGVFIYVGDADGVKEFIGEGTKEERYNGGLIMPGMTDGHAHGNFAATQLFMCSLHGCETLEEIRERLKKFIAEHGDFSVISGMGWVYTTFDENGPTAAMIDDLTDKPMVLLDVGGHAYWLNSAMMKLQGIDKNTPDVNDGVIYRDAEGNPTGYFKEGAVVYFSEHVFHFPIEQYRQAILYFQDVAFSKGLTMYFDPIVNFNGKETGVEEVYRQLDVEGKLKIHVHGGYQVLADKNPVAGVERAAQLRKESKSANFVLDHVKILLDGVVESKTAYLNEPYCNNDESEKDFRGLVLFDADTLTATLKRANELGLITHIHSMGDGATTTSLDAHEKAGTTPEMRNALTHLQIVKPEDIPRMAKLGIVAVTNPFWFVEDPRFHDTLTVPCIGEERAAAQYPLKSLFDAGIVVTTASDYPILTVFNPLQDIQRGVMRQLPNQPETVLGGSERVTVEQMIEAVTLNGAYQLKCEDKLGSITVGKQADIVLLDSDITTCAVEKISDTKVLRTMVGGEWVYSCAD